MRPRDREVYNVSIDSTVPAHQWEDRELIHEFADAQQVEEVGTTDLGPRVQTTYGVVAPNSDEAYRRAANLVEAKYMVADVPDAEVVDGVVFGPDGQEVYPDGR